MRCLLLQSTHSWPCGQEIPRFSTDNRIIQLLFIGNELYIIVNYVMFEKIALTILSYSKLRVVVNRLLCFTQRSLISKPSKNIKEKCTIFMPHKPNVNLSITSHLWRSISF